MLDLSHSQFNRIDELRLPLVNRFYSECRYKVKCGRQDRVYSLALEGEIIAAARLLPQASQDYLLRNLCVLPAMRNRGVASYFVRKFIADMAPQNCYCFALPHLQSFYLALGFNQLAEHQVPPAIAAIHTRNRTRNRDWLLMGFCREPVGNSGSENSESC